MTNVCSPPISPGGALIFDRRVHFNTEYVAHRLAGRPVPDECLVIECWRRHVAVQYPDPFDKPEGLPENLHRALEVARAVRKLRRPRFRHKLYWLDGKKEGDLPVVLSSERGQRERMAVSTAFALQEAQERLDGIGWMDGYGALAIKIRVFPNVTPVAFVAWDTLDVDDIVRVLLWGSFAEKQRAYAATHKEGVRVYREAERLRRRKRDAQGRQVAGG